MSFHNVAVNSSLLVFECTIKKFQSSQKKIIINDDAFMAARLTFSALNTNKNYAIKKSKLNGLLTGTSLSHDKRDPYRGAHQLHDAISTVGSILIDKKFKWGSVHKLSHSLVGVKI